MLLQEKYQKQLKKVLDVFENLNEEDFYELSQDNFDYLVDKVKEKCSFPFKVGSGATKGVFIFQNFGFVIKIPFTMLEEDVEIYEDYCENEVLHYEQAVEHNVENLFLKTELINNYNKYSLYIQEIAEPLSSIENLDSKSSHSEEQYKQIINEYDGDICPSWEADILAIFGEDYYRRFRDFINTADINDLRSANIGYVGKNPVLFDYAGFYE